PGKQRDVDLPNGWSRGFSCAPPRQSIKKAGGPIWPTARGSLGGGPAAFLLARDGRKSPAVVGAERRDAVAGVAERSHSESTFIRAGQGWRGPRAGGELYATASADVNAQPVPGPLHWRTHHRGPREAMREDPIVARFRRAPRGAEQGVQHIGMNVGPALVADLAGRAQARSIRTIVRRTVAVGDSTERTSRNPASWNIDRTPVYALAAATRSPSGATG